MWGIPNFLRRLFKQRQAERFIVQNGTFVIIAPGTDQERKVQLVDISKGGMAFIYQGSPEELEKSGIIKMIVERPYLENFDYETASDIPCAAGGCGQSEVPYRRRGVKFKWLGALKEVELRKYINKVCVDHD